MYKKLSFTSAVSVRVFSMLCNQEKNLIDSEKKRSNKEVNFISFIKSDTFSIILCDKIMISKQ